jgi:hypothetical protein
LTALPYLEALLYPESLKITLLIAQKSPSGDIQLGSSSRVVMLVNPWSLCTGLVYLHSSLLR